MDRALKTQEEWTSAYVQNEVRGRGDNREPHDLLVTDGIAIPRLRRGTLRGRTNRHGFRAECESVHSSSHRYFRNQLEGHECRVHLCGSTPCGQPDDDCIHVLATAIIPRIREMDLQEAAGRGPLARCTTAAWLCGYNSSGMLQSLAKAVRKGLSCLCCCGGCRSGRRRPAAHRERAPSGGSTPRHEDSETESEGEEGHVCQAEAVAYAQGGKAVPLSLSPCRDSARGPKIKLLTSDAEVSSSADLLHEDGNSYFAACSHHRAAYEGQAFKRTCAIEGCGKEVKFVRNGLRLCKSHNSREKEVKGRGSRQDQDSVPTSLTASSEARSAPGGRPVDGTAAKEREEPMAGGPNSTRTNDERQKAALLGKYLTLILEGKNEREALSSCVEGDTGPHETWEILKEQGSGYVAKLPRDYPGVAKRAIIHLVTEECPHLTPPAIAEEDPVLGLKLPPVPSPEPFPQATNTTMPTPKGPSHGQAPGAETRAATPLTASLYLPRRGTSSAFPPRAQDVLAAVARPRHIGASEEEVSEHLAGAPRTWHIGAYTDAEPQALDETAKALQAIAKAVTSKDEAASHEKGKIASIGKTEERLVYIFRGFDALTAPVGSATVGKELFHALKATATQGRPQLRAIQFPVNINNRIAYGLSSMSIGGKDLRALPEHSISAADFPLTSQEEFDAFAGTPDFKLEKRVKGAATLNHWYRNALRQAWAISCVYGTEHYSTFEAAACYLLKTRRGALLRMACPCHFGGVGGALGKTWRGDQGPGPQLEESNVGGVPDFRKDKVLCHRAWN